MASSEFTLSISNNSDKYIEDVIDARKKIGQYDVHQHTTNMDLPQNLLYRNTHSTPMTGINEDFRQILLDDTAMLMGEAPGEPGVFSIGPTDSEITVVRVRREGLQYKTDENKWNLHDDAVPGDGSHLGESPSLVNLVTLVGQSSHYQSLGSRVYEYNEYLVPLSSWDPCDNPYQLPDIALNSERARGGSNKPTLHVIKPPNEASGRRFGLAGKISNFLRKRCAKKSKTVVTEVVPEGSRMTDETGGGSCERLNC